MSSSIATHSAPLPSLRLSSLDQFRGYTMLGMLLVNYLGSYAVCPRILQHTHDYCSYADTIMPQFLFAAGFSLRLSLGKRIEAGKKMPWGRAVRRILGLAFVAIAWYTYCDLTGIANRFQTQPTPVVLYSLFKGDYFQTLLHIAATSLWILPVVTSSWKVRIGYAIASGILHILISWWFNFAWVFTDPTGIDGGPLGFLTWSIPALCGTLACDAVRTSGSRAALRIASCGIGVMLLGWCFSLGSTLYNVSNSEVVNANAVLALGVESSTGNHLSHSNGSSLDPRKFPVDPVIPSWERLSSWDRSIVEPPFVPPPEFQFRKWNYWMMSQQGGTVSYPTFTAGVSLVIYALFLWFCDGIHLRLGLFRTLGTNSLAAYILHDIASWVVSCHFSHDSTAPFWPLAGFGCVVLFVYGICRLLESRGWYLRV